MIGKSTVKTVISEKELENFGLTYEKIKEDDPHTRELIMYTVGEMIRSKGIDLRDRELYIEVFPSGDNGCLMYISDSKGSILVPSEKKRKNTSSKHRRGFMPEIVFSCRNSYELSECAETLLNKAHGNILCSSLFFSPDDFRIIVSLKGSPISVNFPFNTAAAYTREHYTILLSENALEKLSGVLE